MKRASGSAVSFILRLMSTAIGAIMGIFCNFSGCIDTTPEYGMPHADFTIRGTVKSSGENAPIRGISVTVRNAIEGQEVSDQTFSDSLGRYMLQLHGVSRHGEWIIRSEDIDGVENGSFAPKESLLTISEDRLSGGDGRWHFGSGHLDLDIALQEISDPPAQE